MDVHFRNQTGIALLESLIAVFVLSVGLLGIAALHVQSMQTGMSALNRSKAVVLAEDLLERMMANRAQVATYSWGAIPAAATPPIAFTPYNVAANQVALDRTNWTELLQHRDSGLPQGSATVTTAARAGTANSFDVTIVINWTEGLATEQLRVTSVINNAI